MAISGNWSNHKILVLVTDTGAEKALEVGEMLLSYKPEGFIWFFKLTT